MIIEKAKMLRNTIEEVVQNVSDEDAYSSADLFPVWSGSSVEYKTGKKVRYHGKLYKVLQDHTSQEQWTPDVSASLFAEILNPKGVDYPQWVQPESTNPYMLGDKVTHNGKRWRSLCDNNVWEPGFYGWRELS